MPRIPGLLERIQQPLYDSNTVATSGSTTLTYFQIPLGGSVGGGAAKTQVDTNLEQGGALPYPKNFEIHALRLVNQYGATAADLHTLFNSAWFNLFIGTKDYLVVNMFMLTAGVGLSGVAAGSTNVLSAQNGRPDQKGIYVLAEPIDLIPQQNFRCSTNFVWTSPTTGPAAATKLWVYLDGFFKREVH